MNEEINPYGKIYVGPDLTVEMGLFAAKNEHALHDALLCLRGGPAHAAGIDGQVLRYAAVPAGTGTNFDYRKGGETRTRMIARGSWFGWDFFEVFLDGKTIKVFYDEKQSKDARPLHLLTAYAQGQAEAPSRLASERLARDLQVEARGLGWSDVEFKVDWVGREAEPSARRVAFAVLSGLRPTFASLLADSLGRDALATYRSVTVQITEGSGLEVRARDAGLDVAAGVDADASDCGAALLKKFENQL